MGKLFGTDGIRGKAGEYPMNAKIAERTGRAVARFFSKTDGPSKIFIGRDTRESGPMLESALVEGIGAVGANAALAGVLPTPGIAYLAATLKAAAGIVISASHNPYYDNGIKIFNGDGYKLSDEVETAIENMILEGGSKGDVGSVAKKGQVTDESGQARNYFTFLANVLSPGISFKELNIILDCANGATHSMAPELFSGFGAGVEALSIEPNGKNINDGCGSEHPGDLIEKVLSTGADLGLAFDGDGDRLIAVDEQGGILSGDQILAICARDLKQKGRLKNDIVVSTVMSNMGLGAALKEMGILHETSAVGDRYVMQKMIAAGAVLGGEDSGHMIFGDIHTSGDGMLTAIKLIEALQSADMRLSDLKGIMAVYPQVLINVQVNSKPDLGSVPAITDAVKSVESELGDRGRVLVRYSGTQPLCRVMVEGPSEIETQQYCNQLSDIIKEKIG